MLIGDPFFFILNVVFLIPALLIGFTLHELAHAAVAVSRGDPTPRNQGRLSLDPRRHIDPLGLIMVLLIGVGYARPVQINPARLRGELSRLMVALAGPGANLAIAILASIPLKLIAGSGADVLGGPNFLANCSLTVPPLEVLKTELFYIYTLNLYLMVFNLLPIPPLDGFEIIRTALQRRNPRLLFQIETNRQGIILVFVIVVLFVPRLLFGLINFFIGPIVTLLGVPVGFPCR